MNDGDRVNILLVDDQPSKLLAYEAILGELGHNLIKVSSGAEALGQLLKTEFALVLVDVCMPIIDGFELASLIRQHPRCQKTAIIFVSAIASSDLDRIKGYEYGAVDYVSVPIEPELLRARVTVFADLYRKTRALQRLNQELELRVAERTADLEADLAERMRLEKALRESAERLTIIHERAPIGIYEATLKGRLLRVNDEFCRITGYSREELLQRRTHDITHPDDIDADTKHYRRAQTGAAPHYRLEKRFLHKDGRIVWIELHGSVIRDADGIPSFGIGVVQDITQRKRAGESVRRSEERYRALVTATAAIVWRADASGAIVEDMPSWEAFTGQAPDEYKGSGWLNAVHPDDRALAAEHWTRTVHSEGPAEYELRVRRHDSRYSHMLMRVVPVFNAGGELREWVGTCADISESKRAEQNLLYLANYDTLTELPNRVLFMDRLTHALAVASRHKRKVAVLFLDLDGFKHINDTLGHEAGDRLLKTVAGRLVACMRSSDTVARFGGDEFVLILADVARAADASRVAQHILETLSKPLELDGNELFVTTSIGVSFYPRDAQEPQGLLKNADTAMYLAKKGGNSYQHYSSDLGVKASHRMTLERELRRALGRDEFVLHYQPQIELASGQVDTVEALLRWRRPDSGQLMPPMEFIPLAEERGLIVPIGEWVIRAACAQLQAWRSAGLAPVRLALNISARQFRQKNIQKVFDRALKTSDLDHSCMEVERTESLLQTEPAERILPALRAAGITIAIDDFGTGFSSLSYLKRFPVHKLKIDRSFTHSLPQHTDNAAICRAIVAMAHSLNLKVTAEGVETEEQLAFLRTLDCDAVQGYLLSRPLPAEEFSRQLARPVNQAPQSLGQDASM